MNSFRDSLIRQFERLKLKVDQHIGKYAQKMSDSNSQKCKIVFDDKKV